MSGIIRYTCYGIFGFGILALIAGIASSDAPLVRLGVFLSFIFGTFSALLNVKRVF
jgi:hypothetical protein